MANPQVGALPANPSASAPGDTTSAGSSGDNAALGSHRHAREGFGLTGDMQVEGTAAAGASGRVADAAHIHPAAAGGAGSKAFAFFMG